MNDMVFRRLLWREALGAYFHIADTIVQMDRYEPKEITAFAKKQKIFPALSAGAGRTGICTLSETGKGIWGNDRIKMKTWKGSCAD